MKEEILPINLLRFLAALSILFVHKFASLIEIGYLPHFLSFLIPFSEYGYLGVNLFFLISGFVITLSSEGRTVGQFISARFIRLFPIFWICVSITSLITLFLSNEHISLLKFAANLTMTPEYFGANSFIDGSYWTLGIELRFYMFIAFILLVRAFVATSLQKIALYLTVPLLYLTLYFNPYSISLIDNIFLNIFYYFGSEYAQYFIAGILFYGIYKNNKSLYHYGAIAICYLVAVIRAINAAYTNNSPTIITIFITLFFVVFLAISLQKIPNTSFSFLGNHYRKILITLGAITYPLYLLHSKIMQLLTDTFINHAIPSYIASPLLLFIMISLILFVNNVDFTINTYWKKSSVIKGILARSNHPWLRRVL